MVYCQDEEFYCLYRPCVTWAKGWKPDEYLEIKLNKTLAVRCPAFVKWSSPLRDENCFLLY